MPQPAAPCSSTSVTEEDARPSTAVSCQMQTSGSEGRRYGSEGVGGSSRSITLRHPPDETWEPTAGWPFEWKLTRIFDY